MTGVASDEARAGRPTAQAPAGLGDTATIANAAVESNFETALKAERKRVVRCFNQYSSETRANHAASFRLGHRQREAVGEFFYTHPDIPMRGFPTRTAAAKAALGGAA